MKILVTGSAGHLGEALMRTLQRSDHDAVGVDILASPFTTHVGSITDSAFIASCITNVDAVIHTATLHKPHVESHSKQDFIDVNVTGTLNLLEMAHAGDVNRFIFTSTTSAFGNALTPPKGAPAAWITEDVVPVPKNIYGVTKVAAEDLCELFHKLHGLPCIVLRTSRFFPEDDDSAATRDEFDGVNAKVNEILFRRIDIEDAVSAHLAAIKCAPEIGFGRYIISATSPFTQDDLAELRRDAPAALRRHKDFDTDYKQLGWRMFPSIDRVYVNAHARVDLGWRPAYDFASILERLRVGEPPFSKLAYEVGVKGYHPEAQKVYPFN
ncbi:MAG: NAD(P)-dependent oxidoreductase [Pseudomonadota bacterium]